MFTRQYDTRLCIIYEWNYGADEYEELFIIFNLSARLK